MIGKDVLRIKRVKVTIIVDNTCACMYIHDAHIFFTLYIGV